MTTNAYEPVTGRLVGQTVAGVGELTATYSDVGDLLTQEMPGGLDALVRRSVTTTTDENPDVVTRVVRGPRGRGQ